MQTVNILANSDISFEPGTLTKVKKLDLFGRALSLARWDQRADESVHGNGCNPCSTQDTWIFRGRIRPVEDAEFCLGKPNCDHAINDRLRAAGYDLFNPYREIKTLHRHDSNHRTYRHGGIDDAPRPYAHVWPCSLSEITPRVFWPGIIAFSLFGQDGRYLKGAVENARLAREIYPGWCCRFYCDSSVPAIVIDALRIFGADVVMVPRQQRKLDGTFWRLLVADDLRAERWIIRDADSRLNCREWAAVDDWVRSDQPFHLTRDHPWHGRPILLCGFGGVRGALANMTEKIENWRERGHEYGDDETFMEHIIWPLIRRQTLQHESFPTAHPGTKRPFPTPYAEHDWHFVGERFNPDGTVWEKDRAKLMEAAKGNK